MIYVGFISHFVCQHSVFLFLNLLCCIPLYEYNTIHLYIFLMRNWTSVKSKVKGPILNNGLLLFSCSVVFDSLPPHGLQHCSLPCPSLSSGVFSNSCPLSWWCHPTISCSVAYFSCPHSFPEFRVFSNEQVVCNRWSKYWSFSISPSNEYSELIYFRTDWFDLLAVQGTLKSLLQHHSSKASFFGAQPSLGSKSHIPMWLLEKP